MNRNNLFIYLRLTLFPNNYASHISINAQLSFKYTIVTSLLDYRTLTFFKCNTYTIKYVCKFAVNKMFTWDLLKIFLL